MHASSTRRLRTRLLSAAATAAALVLAPAGAGAETLQDALALAYSNNPNLDAARAQLRAQDESFIQARSQALPSLTGTIQAGSSDAVRSGPGTGGGGQIDPNTGLPLAGRPNASDSWSYSLSATQNLFRGGRTGAAMDQAMANILAGRAQLTSAEQQVLVDTVSAYMDVRRDEAILAIRQNNVSVLDRQLQASRDRFEVGEITRTDVSQAEARLFGARAEFAAAQSALTTSRAAYERIVGQAPGTLEPEPPLPALPADLQAAYDAAMDSNPEVIAAAFQEEAASASVRNARGAMLPTVSLNASLGKSENFDGGPFEYAGDPLATESTQIGGRISIPLFSGNALSSQVRSARQNETAARLSLRDTERRAREAVSSAWSAYLASVSQTESSAEQVRANELAYEGVEAEAAVGLRTTLDVLNAEQELLNARLAQVQSQRNAYVAGFRVLQAVGAVTPETLGLDVEVYDPSVNLQRVKWQFLGIGVLE